MTEHRIYRWSELKNLTEKTNNVQRIEIGNEKFIFKRKPSCIPQGKNRFSQKC